MMEPDLQDRWNSMSVGERSRLVKELLDSNAELCKYGDLSPELRKILDDYASDGHMNSVLGIDDALYDFPDNDAPETCHGGENHECDSRRQKISYNASGHAADGIHFADDDGTRSTAADILTKTYTCLRCRQEVTEVYRLELTEFADGPLERCPNCLGDGMFKRCTRCDGSGCIYCEAGDDQGMVDGKDCAMCSGTGVFETPPDPHDAAVSETCT